MYQMTEVYGGRKVITYHLSMEHALQSLDECIKRKDDQPLDLTHLPDMVKGMRELIVIKHDTSLNLIGIPYLEWQDFTHGIPNCSVSINEIDFTPSGDTFYQVVYKSGYMSSAVWERSEGYYDSLDAVNFIYATDRHTKDWESGPINYPAPYLSINRCTLLTGSEI